MRIVKVNMQERWFVDTVLCGKVVGPQLAAGSNTGHSWPVQ